MTYGGNHLVGGAHPAVAREDEVHADLVLFLGARSAGIADDGHIVIFVHSVSERSHDDRSGGVSHQDDVLSAGTSEIHFDIRVVERVDGVLGDDEIARLRA